MGRETREGRETISSAGRRQEPTGPLPTPGKAALSEEEEGEGGCSAPANPGIQGRWELRGAAGKGREQQHPSTREDGVLTRGSLPQLGSVSGCSLQPGAGDGDLFTAASPLQQ